MNEITPTPEPTPPAAPWTSTVSPGPTGAITRSICHAVR